MIVSIIILLGVSNAFSQNEMHVYSMEIPWEPANITQDPDKNYSINEAIGLASSGDIILVHKGIYREKVLVNKNNITISNFQNEYVLVTGADLVTGTWADATGMTAGVKVTDISNLNIETDYSQLFSKGKVQQMGRHPNNTIDKMMEVLDPNGGYALLSNGNKPSGVNATGQITFEQTTIPSVDLTGGIVRLMTGKMRNYAYGDIVSNSGNTISFNTINNNTDWKKENAIASTRFKFSWGYVLHKNLVDVPGEWFIDGNNLYYYPLIEEDVDESRIEIQVRERVLVLNNTTGVSITGINFVAGNVDAQSTNNATIDNSSYRYLYPFWTPTGYGQGDTDRRGIYMVNSSGNTIKNTYIGHSPGNMIALRDGSNNTFENCIIEDFGWIGVFTSGIHIRESDNTNITKCTFGDAGRFQIRIDGGDAKVNIMDSDFYGAMKMGEDAGPIEATSTGEIGAIDMKESVIAYNKVHDVSGIPVSDGNYNKQKIVAFYMEDTQNYTAHHNLVYNFKADNYTGPVSIEKSGEFLYLGPRYNRMEKPVNYYNNTLWNFDKLVSIWNIEIDNWEELGLAEEDNTGTMEDGHFANNIFMDGSLYRLSYVRQKLSSTGGNIGWVTLNPSPSLETTNFDEYITHCANYGYHYNPENNVLINQSNTADNFIDAANGDFRLKSSSTAKNAGVEIPGITSSATPDSGALEGGDRALNAGANLIVPMFLEETTLVLDTQFTIAVTSETCLNKSNGTLSINPSIGGNYEVSFNGEVYDFKNEKSFNDIVPGSYEICINIKGEIERQCYNVEVGEADEISLKSSLKNKQLEVSGVTGTAPYKVLVNNYEVLETMFNSFTVNVDQGDIVIIKTDKVCEGELEQIIDFYSNINPFPNPTSGEFRITLPITEGKIPIEIYNAQGQLISSKVYTINFGEVQLNLTGKPSGLYFAKVMVEQPISFKIVKN